MRIILSVVSLAVLLTPFWMWLGFRGIVNPEGFLQEFFVIGIGVWFLLGTQFLCLVIWLVILSVIWSSSETKLTIQD
ncbi:hypothetical protein C0584_01270 [Candidatus Parcubacteria bacterium]|nr:MAG: hypothetical protein C0584_01270 [Candidatus Parcubacteria bacterium]